MGVFQSGDKYSVPRLHDVAATQGIGGSAQWSVPSTFDCPGDKKAVDEIKGFFELFFWALLLTWYDLILPNSLSHPFFLLQIFAIYLKF